MRAQGYSFSPRAHLIRRSSTSKPTTVSPTPLGGCGVTRSGLPCKACCTKKAPSALFQGVSGDGCCIVVASLLHPFSRVREPLLHSVRSRFAKPFSFSSRHTLSCCIAVALGANRDSEKLNGYQRDSGCNSRATTGHCCITVAPLLRRTVFGVSRAIPCACAGHECCASGSQRRRCRSVS